MKLFHVVGAYGIPPHIVKSINIVYVNTSEAVLIPEGITDKFPIDTGVLQRDHLTCFLFIVLCTVLFSMPPLIWIDSH